MFPVVTATAKRVLGAMAAMVFEPISHNVGTLFERLVSWTVRSVATALLMAGVAMLVAAIPAWPLTAGTDAPRAIVIVLGQMGTVLVIGGVASKFLLRGRAPALPNEQITVTEELRPALGGELLVLALVLIAVPIWLVVQLQPFLAEWGFVWSYLADPELWDNANANMSGVILIPLAGALTPPFLQLLALVGFAAASITLVSLMVVRSPRFPRIYLACVVLISTVLFASVRATSGAMLAGDAVRQEMTRVAGTSVAASEDDVLRNALDRYSNAVRGARPPLAWAWFAYVLWVPLLLVSGRARTTFGARVKQVVTTPESAADLEAITRPPRSPGLGF
jgi:hypothetical protein